MCGSRQKDRASHEVRGVRIYFVNPACAWQSSNKFGFALAWSGFLSADDSALVELPVIIYQVKPDRLEIFKNMIEIYCQIGSFCQLLKNPILKIGIFGFC